uniref:Fatty acid desaturase domain-containing protein n=1 Tax=Panagrolaimus davidi TaxID=227884 RepID=A0A914QH64_9BILA
MLNGKHICGVTIVVWFWSTLGIGAGAHRLWAHKSYKAKWPLEIFLMLGFTMAFQNDVIEWCRDHRCHHKWTDTDADPHNTNRGFFFSHMGWLLQRKHPKLKEMGSKLDMSDLKRNPILAFQRKYYLLLALIMCFLIPTIIPVYFWDENVAVGFYTAGVFRYCILLHFTWMINSVCHFFGYKPYDARITPADSKWTSLVALGEGGHNYHHTFPQDYRTSEMPVIFNITKHFIEFWAFIGLAYDLKSVTKEVVKRQKEKYGEKYVKVQ